MTGQDEQRVAKGLPARRLPGRQRHLADYAESRDDNAKTVHTLRSLSAGTYRSMQEILDAVPQKPEGDQSADHERCDS